MAMYRGDLITGLMDMVSVALKDSPESHQLVQSALELAYYDGRLDGTIAAVRGVTGVPAVDPTIEDLANLRDVMRGRQ
jgi:hypothetical protein